MKYGALPSGLAQMMAHEIDPMEFGKKARKGGTDKVTEKGQGSTAVSRKNTLRAASGAPPVMMKLISRVTSRQQLNNLCLLYTSPSPRDQRGSRMPSSA